MKNLTLAQAKKLLDFKRRTQRAPRAWDNTTTQAGLERVIKAIRKQSLRRTLRFAWQIEWLRHLTGK